MDLRTLASVVGCIAGVTIGSLFVIFGGPTVTTTGVILVIIGLVSLLLAVGFFISNEPGRDETGSVEYG